MNNNQFNINNSQNQYTQIPPNNFNNTVNSNQQFNQQMNTQQPNQISQQSIQNQDFYTQDTQKLEQIPTNLMQEPVINNYDIPKVEKKKLNTKTLMIIVIIAIAILSGLIFIPKLIKNKNIENITGTLTNSTSFILYDKGLYAIFDIDGNQITDFEFQNASYQFVNGTALVKNSSGEYGIISSSGKMLVEFGKYKYIYEREAVYEATDENYNSYLYNRAGKLVRQLDKNEDIIEYSGVYTCVLIKSDTKYIVLDYNGDEITEFPVSSNDDIDDPIADDYGNYVYIFYNNVNYIIHIPTKKVVISFPDERRFFIKDVNETDENEFIIYSYTSASTPKYDYKFIKNGKVIFSKESDTSIDMKFEEDNIIYSEGNGKSYLLNETGHNAVELFYTNYKDYKNYITQADGILNGSELYVNGQLKEKIRCYSIETGYAKHGVYLLKNCSQYGAADKIFINYDGTKINNVSYILAYPFDENGYAVVSEDKNKFYLINLKGEKVSKDFVADGSAQRIHSVDGTNNFYWWTNEDGTKTVFNVEGNVSLTGKSVKTEISNGIVYGILEQENGYEIYDIVKNKKIVTVKSEPRTSKNYFTTSENSKTQYYSYTTGKLFYER